MNRYPAPEKLKEALDYLDSNNLWAYDLELISKYIVGLNINLCRDIPSTAFNRDNPIPAEWIEILIKTCAGIRSRLSELQIDREHRSHEVLERIVEYTSTLFTASYRISQDIIDESKFYEKVYFLLRELNLRDSSSRLHSAWDSRSDSEKEAEKEKYKKELLDFVRDNPSEVVTTVYHWAYEGIGHNAKIKPEQEKIINLFYLIKSEKEFSKAAHISSDFKPNPQY
ncbi:hypothetical protein BKM15_18305 [Pseudomonas syringae pv. syringae]|nr:hypothetical protein BKM15_18305 [Pseudomonas syringae pv. syringae]